MDSTQCFVFDVNRGQDMIDEKGQVVSGRKKKHCFAAFLKLSFSKNTEKAFAMIGFYRICLIFQVKRMNKTSVYNPDIDKSIR